MIIRTRCVFSWTGWQGRGGWGVGGGGVGGGGWGGVGGGGGGVGWGGWGGGGGGWGGGGGVGWGVGGGGGGGGVGGRIGPLFAKRTDVLPPPNLGWYFSNRSEIWQAHRQQRGWDACQISERYNKYDIQSRALETSRDLAVKRLTLSWIKGAVMRLPTWGDMILAYFFSRP